MKPLISIIIPAYNNANEIKRCLRSVLEQTYTNIEIIVVNDGSTDATGNIIDEYACTFPDKVKVFHKENGGVTSARLWGVRKSKGEWIGFVDGDDEISSDMYEFLLKNAIEYQAHISHCGYQMMFEDRRVSYFYNTGRCIQQDRSTGLKDLLEGSFIEPGLCNKLFHRTLFYDLLHEDIMPTNIKINEDLLMNYYLFSRSEKSIYEDVCKYHYMVRCNSASRQSLNLNRIYDPIKVKQIIVDSIQDNLKDIAYKAYMSTCVNVYNSLSFTRKKEFYKDKCKIREELISHNKWGVYLSKKQRLLMKLIIYIPHIYPYIYRSYAKYIMKNPYN